MGYPETEPWIMGARLCVLYFSALFSRFLDVANILCVNKSEGLLRKRTSWGKTNFWGPNSNRIIEWCRWPPVFSFHLVLLSSKDFKEIISVALTSLREVKFYPKSNSWEVSACRQKSIVQDDTVIQWLRWKLNQLLPFPHYCLLTRAELSLGFV